MNKVIELNLPTEAFSISTLQEIYASNNISKNFIDTVNYIKKYYFEVARGMYVYYNIDNYEKTGSFELRSVDEFKKEIMYKVDGTKSIYDMLKMNDKIHRFISNVHMPRYYRIDNQYYINECAGFLHKKYKNYDDYDASIKTNVQKIIDMICEITCHNSKEMLNAYLKYLSIICHGRKSEIVIYKKSIEGCGKSTETEFLINYVFGRDICLISGIEPLTTVHNKIFFGKLFVIFEELPTFSKAQWMGVSSRLKTLTTEKTCVYRDLYEKSIEGSNLLNFQINTNVDALKESQGRRIMIMDINPSRVKDYNYFKDIKNNCFNNETGEAFFSYLMTKIELTDFHCERDFPETRNKLFAISNLMDSSYKFLKHEYYLKKIGIAKISCKELHEKYMFYCNENKISLPLGRNDFYEKLLLIKIERKDIKKTPFYKVDYNHLQEIANRDKWICEYDEFEKSDEEIVINKLYPALQKIDNEKENEIIKLKQKIIELEQHIFDLMQVENIIIEKEQFIDVEKVKVKRKYTKKDKIKKNDIVEKQIEIKQTKIDLDIVFMDSELSAFF